MKEVVFDTAAGKSWEVLARLHDVSWFCSIRILINDTLLSIMPPNFTSKVHKKTMRFFNAAMFLFLLLYVSHQYNLSFSN
jgi:hypothetical protein